MFHRSFSKRRFSGHRSAKNYGRGGGNGGRSSIAASRYINKAQPKQAVENVPIKNTFNDFDIHPQLKQNIARRGYTQPTPIQDQAIPLVLQGKDVIGVANTGTGKTAAFLVPLLNKLMQNKDEKILIVVPTRELAVQIRDELRIFSQALQVQSLLIMGGSNMQRQIMEFRQHPHVIIATPGRLKDLLMRRSVQLDSYKNIVLDEVDRMVDIGFIKDIKYIISYLPRQRQSLFFSATVSGEIDSIIKAFVTNPVKVSVKVAETAQSIDQDVIHVRGKNEKIVKLQSLLRQEEFKKVLVFGRTKWGVERLSKTLQQNGFMADSIHGNKSQSQRLRALSHFKQNRLQVLVATDVIARGLDIDDVSHVINFDEPSSYTDYVHRIGRTGRAHKQGKALTFVG